MTADRDYVNAAMELAADRVMYDARDADIVDAVEEIVGRPIRLYRDRIERAIIAAYNEIDDLAMRSDVSDDAVRAEFDRVQLRVVNVYGLC